MNIALPGNFVNRLGISKPSLLVNRLRTLGKIQKMMVNAEKAAVDFRPHFKTHQSAGIGEWFRQHNINRIAVSSVDMAEYFVDNGWTDIVIAFPVNIRQLSLIDKLAQKAQIGIIVDSPKTVEYVNKNSTANLDVWIELDCGQQRSGIEIDNYVLLLDTARIINKAENLNFKGFLTHAGQTYSARGHEMIMEVHNYVSSRLIALKDHFSGNGFPGVSISYGDTPSCSVSSDFDGIDEIRPGNFIFYDLMQLQIGACSVDEISLLLACPVVSKNAAKGKIVVYGGAVHFGLDRIEDEVFGEIFGYAAVVNPENNSIQLLRDVPLTRLSQEHGVIETTTEIAQNLKAGDFIAFIPVHSCITAANFDRYYDWEGNVITKFRNIT